MEKHAETEIDYILKVAEQGHADAQSSIGYMYYKGDGVTQDFGEAVKWLSKAADQGDTSAQFNLGFMYYDGDGVTQDYVQGYMWVTLAVSKLKGEARKAAVGVRDTITKNMTQFQIAEAQRLARELTESISKGQQ